MSVFPNYIWLEPPELAAYSDLVVLGHVSGAPCVGRGPEPSEAGRLRMYEQGLTDYDLINLIAYEGDMLYTRWSFQVDDVLKGEISSDRIDVATEGGAVNGWVVEVAGAPQLEPGQQYVAFLNAGIGDAYTPACVFVVTGGVAAADGGNYRGSLPLADLLLEVASHKDDPCPYRRAASLRIPNGPTFP